MSTPSNNPYVIHLNREIDELSFRLTTYKVALLAFEQVNNVDVSAPVASRAAESREVSEVG